MQTNSFRLSIPRQPLVLGIALELALVSGVMAGPSAESPDGAQATVQAGQATAPVMRGSQRAFIDPQTGELTSKPSQDQRATVTADPQMQQNFSHQGLVEEILPDGSVMVDLKGRFQVPLYGTVDEEHRLRMSHTPPADEQPHDNQ